MFIRSANSLYSVFPDERVDLSSSVARPQTTQTGLLLSAVLILSSFGPDVVRHGPGGSHKA